MSGASLPDEIPRFVFYLGAQADGWVPEHRRGRKGPPFREAPATQTQHVPVSVHVAVVGLEELGPGGDREQAAAGMGGINPGGHAA